MKQYFNLFFVAVIAIVAIAIVSCNGNGGNSTKQNNSAQIEQQKQDSIRKANERTEAERVKKEQEERDRIETEKKKWRGATSRSDLKNKLNGTTWETIDSYSTTGLFYKFRINGESVTMYSAHPTHNYDDVKNWGDGFDMVIHEIAEPKQGLYCVICKAVDDSDARGAVPTILVFQGEDVIYSLGGEMGPKLKKVQ